MNNFCRFILLTLVASYSLLSSVSLPAAEEAPLTIEKSQSPDGSKDIIIVPSEDDTGIAGGTAKIRDVKTGKILGSFEWSGFGMHASSTSFDVLWSPDSRCFAINWEVTRGFVTCAVYAQTRHGWRQIKLPEFGELSLKMARATGENSIYVGENIGGKGHETAQTWLSGHELRIEAGYRGILPKKGTGDSEQLFWFNLQIVPPHAVLKSVHLAPDAAYRKE